MYRADKQWRCEWQIVRFFVPFLFSFFLSLFLPLSPSPSPLPHSCPFLFPLCFASRAAVVTGHAKEYSKRARGILKEDWKYARYEQASVMSKKKKFYRETFVKKKTISDLVINYFARPRFFLQLRKILRSCSSNWTFLYENTICLISSGKC